MALKIYRAIDLADDTDSLFMIDTWNKRVAVCDYRTDHPWLSIGYDELKDVIYSRPARFDDAVKPVLERTVTI